MHYLFRLLCIEHHLVSVEYFMDRMQDYEIDTLLDNLQYDGVNEWEQTRLKIYSTAQMMSKKQLTPKDLMEFPWEKEEEKEEEEEHKTSISNEEIEMLQKEARKIQQTEYGIKLHGTSDSGHQAARPSIEQECQGSASVPDED